MNTKQTPPSQEAQFEDQLRKRVEHRGALSPDTIHVADTSTGEQVELDPVRKMSAFEIYKKIKKQVDAKSAAEMGETLGVDITTEEVPAKDELDQLMRDLAEDIYDALEKCHKSIAVIKPESIGSKTIARLDEKGDANFLVAPGEGERLYESLQNQDADFRTVEKNSYGFVLENKTVGFKVMFIYQERLDGDGTPKKLEELKDTDTPDEDAAQDGTVRIQNQKAANQSKMGQGGSLAA
ncbi:MAG TPA: hypothetical protein DEG44_03140 [Candidatus Kerfeldbacteria bacterium]|nr:hypothetical protein [Candidatus Kerfeldbacteria bacterium]